MVEVDHVGTCGFYLSDQHSRNARVTRFAWWWVATAVPRVVSSFDLWFSLAVACSAGQPVQPPTGSQRPAAADPARVRIPTGLPDLRITVQQSCRLRCNAAWCMLVAPRLLAALLLGCPVWVVSYKVCLLPISPSMALAASTSNPAVASLMCMPRRREGTAKPQAAKQLESQQTRLQPVPAQQVRPSAVMPSQLCASSCVHWLACHAHAFRG